MRHLRIELTGLVLTLLAANVSSATIISEVLVPPDTPGNAYTGTFYVTPSESLWAFGVANDYIQDTAISGISRIDGLRAGDHWVSALISINSWNSGFNFDSIRPIGATPPSAFSIDTTAVPWQWDDNNYVAFYWLSEAGDDMENPLAVLQTGTEYDAFKFFASEPASPFAAFTAADGGDMITGETIVTIVPEPSSFALAGVAMIGLVALGLRTRRAARRRPQHEI